MAAGVSSRRTILGAAVGAVGAFVAGSLGRAAPTSAANGDPLIAGGSTGTTQATTLTNSANNQPAFRVNAASAGTAIEGFSPDKMGVFGRAGSGSTLGVGIWGVGGSVGVYGEGDGPNGRGIQGFGHIGVEGESPDLGVRGASSDGEGVLGSTRSSNGVRGETESGTASGVIGTNSGGGFGTYGRSNELGGKGVFGEAVKGTALTGQGDVAMNGHGTSTTKAAVSGVSTGNNTGVLGLSGSNKPTNQVKTGVHGFSGLSSSTAVGVRGEAPSGRGGVFIGARAGIRLLPTAGKRPTTGLTGDLVVDGSGNLWFCKGGTNWVKLA